MKASLFVFPALLINSALFCQTTVRVQNGAQLVCSGPIVINLQDLNQLLNNGTFIAGNSKLIVKGTTIPALIGSSGGSVIDFYDLVLDNSPGVALAQPIGINDTVTFVSGNFNLKNNAVAFSATGGIKNETENMRFMDDPANSGAVSITQNLGQSPGTNPANLGVEILPTAVALGTTTITRYCGVVVYNGNSLGLIQRYYRIEPSINTNLNATARFYYLNAELNGVDPATAVLWKSNNNGVSWSYIVPDVRDINAKYLQKNAINDFSLWTIGSINSVLPVVFNSFNSICNDRGSELQWSTSQEINAAFFVLEKTEDGINWRTVTQINASGQASSYNFQDHYTGPAFYRLKIVDQDGHSRYSLIIKSNCEVKSLTILLYPNPAGNYTNLLFQSSHAFDGVIYIYDAAGRLMRKISSAFQSGQNILRINLAGLANGSYTIMLKDKEINISKVIVLQ